MQNKRIVQDATPNITAQGSQKIPKKWLCVGAHAPTHNHFFGYLW
jgi:hypothetical protein